MTDVIVVGGGVIGTCTARALARQGRDVVLLERFRIPHKHGSSHGASRIFRLAHDRVDDVIEAVRAHEH